MNGLHHYFIVVRYTVHCPGKDMSLCMTQESLLHWPDIIKIALYQSSFPTRLQAPRGEAVVCMFILVSPASNLGPAFSPFFYAFVHALSHALNTLSQLSTWPTPPQWLPWSLWLPSLCSHNALDLSVKVYSHTAMHSRPFFLSGGLVALRAGPCVPHLCIYYF